MPNPCVKSEVFELRAEEHPVDSLVFRPRRSLHRIHLREPLKRLGEYTVPVRLHREVTIDLKVRVAPEGEVIVGHLTPEQEAELAKAEEESAAD